MYKRQLKFIALFSSIAGRTGNKGQSDYAMGNEVLNKMAQELRVQRPACHVISIGWGPWQGGMVTPELERAFLAQGISAIPKDTGVKYFVDEIAAGRGDDAECVVAGLPFPTVLEFDVVPAEDRYLYDHMLSGKPVVPAMMVLEWFAQAAESTFPGQKLSSVEDFKVLKGVVCDGPRTRVRITLEEAAGSSHRARAVEAKLFVVDGAQARLGYKATVRVSSEPHTLTTMAKPGDLGTRRYALGIDAAYREQLFHGEKFRVIEVVDGISDAGMVARLRPSSPATWSVNKPAGWVTDPAVLDGALQMLVLWLRDKLGASSLPSSVGRYVQHGSLQNGPLSVYLRLKDVSAHSGVADIAIVDAAGTLVAEMLGTELTVSAALNPMFTQLAGGSEASV